MFVLISTGFCNIYLSFAIICCAWICCFPLLGKRNEEGEVANSDKEDEGSPKWNYTVKCHVITTLAVFLILLFTVYGISVSYIIFSKTTENDMCQSSFHNVQIMCWSKKSCTDSVNNLGILYSNSSLYQCRKTANNTLLCVYENNTRPCKYCLKQNDLDTTNQHLMWLCVGMLFGCFILFTIFILCQCAPAARCCKVFASSIRSAYAFILVAFFYPLPMKEEDKTKLKTELITLKFCAWEYAGWDTLWAGIVTCLCDKLEEKFGQYRSRYFRKNKTDYKMNVDLMVKSKRFNPSSSYEVMRPYTWCCVPKFICALSMVFIVMCLPLVIAMICFSVERQSVKIVFGILIGVVILTFIPFAAKLLILLSKSTKSYIESLQKKMSRPDFSEELGFMHLVKQEVQFLNLLTEYMETYERKRFRILLIVDELDRCEKRKVLKMLQAINILLSEPNTRFISLIAVDPRVVVKALELTVDIIKEDSRNIGHEYLKKIIHLPLWLPEMDGDKIDKFCKSYMNFTDNTAPASSRDAGDQAENDNAPRVGEQGGVLPGTSAKNGNTEETHNETEPLLDASQGNGNTRESNYKDPLQTALQEIHDKNVFRNPRSIKRICNILNLAMRMYVSKRPSNSPEDIRRLVSTN